MAIISTLLWLGGSILLFIWVGTRNKMIREGTWAEQGGAGAYLWLVIYLVMIVSGFLLGLRL